MRTARVDPAAARAIVSTGEGKRRVDAIRALFTSLIAMETAASERQRARADSAGRLAIAAGIAGIAGAVLLILAFALYLARTVVRPVRRMEAETEQLEKRVDINRALLDASVDGIRLVDLEGRTLLANSVIEHLTSDVFGLPKDATLQEGAAIADRMSDPASFMATLQAIADDPECATQDDFELIDVRRAFQRHTGPVRDSAGELIGRIIVIREITAEREAARLKSELVATVSHELRTPLTGVLGFAELLMQEDLDDDTSRRYVQTIHSEARRLTALVDDFLDVQKIEAGRFTLALESFELSELLAAPGRAVLGTVLAPPAGIRRPRRAAGDGGRPQPHRPGDREPPVQRDQVLARRRRRDDHRSAPRGLRPRAGERLRTRHPRLPAGTGIQPVLPCRLLRHPGNRRNGTRPGALPRDRDRPRRPDRLREHRGEPAARSGSSCRMRGARVPPTTAHACS